MISGLLENSMEVKFDRPDPPTVADYGNGLTPTQRQRYYHLSQGSEIIPWILMTAVDVADPGSAKHLSRTLSVTACCPIRGATTGCLWA
jgi:hypothetical protein